MQVVTRFAPTISGDLHIGGLYNALLNYLYAKKKEGLFKLRLDGQVLTEERKSWQDGIQRDLEKFGIYSDQVLKQSERVQTYKEAVSDFIKDNNRVYFCDCSVQDLVKRAHEGSATDNFQYEHESKFYHLYRPEKYPPFCKIVQIKIQSTESEDNIAADCSVESSFETKDSCKNLTCRQPSANKYWDPFEVGYGFHPAQPEVVIDLGTLRTIRSFEIVWRDRPVLEYEIAVKRHDKWYTILKVAKRDQYFIEHKPGQPYRLMTGDKNNFAPINAQYIRLTITRCAVPVDRPYFYDYHCRNLGKKLDLNNNRATMRLVYDDSIRRYFNNFITCRRFPEEDIQPDSCFWYTREANLVFTSPFDDHELGVTHLIRGEDIYPFLLIEGQVAIAMNKAVRDQFYHGMVIDKRGYKYSKFIKSTPVREYLKNGITPDMILTYLACKMEIIPNLNTFFNITQLTEFFSEKYMTSKNLVIDEKEMIESIKSRSYKNG